MCIPVGPSNSHCGRRQDCTRCESRVYEQSTCVSCAARLAAGGAAGCRCGGEGTHWPSGACAGASGMAGCHWAAGSGTFPACGMQCASPASTARHPTHCGCSPTALITHPSTLFQAKLEEEQAGRKLTAAEQEVRCIRRGSRCCWMLVRGVGVCPCLASLPVRMRCSSPTPDCRCHCLAQVLALRGELESKARALQGLQADMKGLQVGGAAAVPGRSPAPQTRTAVQYRFPAHVH